MKKTNKKTNEQVDAWGNDKSKCPQKKKKDTFKKQQQQKH